MNVLWLSKAQLAKSSTSKEAAKWGFQLLPMTGSTPEKLAMLDLFESLDQDLHIITNYHGLNADVIFKKLRKIHWQVIVIDEVHQLKGGANATPTKLWTRTADLVTSQVAENGCFPVFLTASPVNNKPEEIWAYLHMFDPVRFPSLREFTKKFATKAWGQLNLNVELLVKTLATNMIRRRKDEVGIQLPPKTFMPTYEIEWDTSSSFGKVYNDLKTKILVEADAMDPDAQLNLGTLLAKMHYLRLAPLSPGYMEYNFYPVDPMTGEKAEKPIRKPLTWEPNYPKLDAVLEKILELRDEGENVIVFSAQFNDPLKWLYDTLTGFGHSCGRIYEDHHKHSDVEGDFQQNKTNILLVNVQSGAEGFNFQRSDDWPGGASHVIFLDRWWNPEKNRQAEDRTWRVGTNKPVFIWKFFLDKSVDQIIDALEASKTATAAGIVEDKKMRAGDWTKLLHKYLG